MRPARFGDASQSSLGIMAVLYYRDVTQRDDANGRLSLFRTGKRRSEYIAPTRMHGRMLMGHSTPIALPLQSADDCPLVCPLESGPP